MLVLVAAELPLIYSVPVVPESVTAKKYQVFVASFVVLVNCCSAPSPPVVMAKRTLPLLLAGAKNM